MSNLNAWENISLPLAYHAPRKLPEALREVRALLGELGGVGEELLAKLPEHMTLYERRLAGYVRALLEAPELLGARVRRRRPRADQAPARRALRRGVPGAPAGRHVRAVGRMREERKRSDHDKLTDRFAPPRRFRGIRSRVNTFLLTAVIGFAGLLGLIAYKQGMFVQHTNVYFHAPDATGINKGTAVRLHGVPVGSVRTSSSPSAASGCAWASTANTSRACRAARKRAARATSARPRSRFPGTSTTDRVRSPRATRSASSRRRAWPTCWTRCASSSPRFRRAAQGGLRDGGPEQRLPQVGERPAHDAGGAAAGHARAA